MLDWVDGRPAAELSVRDRGLAYGDGLFETLAVRAWKRGVGAWRSLSTPRRCARSCWRSARRWATVSPS